MKTVLQKEKTIQFWDDYHASCAASNSSETNTKNKNHDDPHPNKEWILQPSLEIFERLYALLPLPSEAAKDSQTTDSTVPSLPATKRERIQILEIGCGTSRMARDFLLFCRDQKGRDDINIIATDVSQICLAQNRERDRDMLLSSSGEDAVEEDETSQENGYLEYECLNITLPLVPVDEDAMEGASASVTDPKPATNSKFPPSSFDMILDKGCLDTFLFRTRQRGDHRQKVARTVLDNICYLLKDPCLASSTGNSTSASQKCPSEMGGVYTIQTPRAKFRPVKEYPGFAKVVRTTLDDNQGILVPTGAGDFKQNGELKREKLYLYSCYKRSDRGHNKEQSRDSADPQQQLEMPKAASPLLDTDDCHKCGITFLDFRKGEALKGRGAKFWERLFRGHCRHCKGTSNP